MTKLKTVIAKVMTFVKKMIEAFKVGKKSEDAKATKK